jgi:hypothetical protein
MKETELRLRLPDNLHRRFKIVCIQRQLSVPKQVAELIRKFVEVRENDQKLIKE